VKRSPRPRESTARPAGDRGAAVALRECRIQPNYSVDVAQHRRGTRFQKPGLRSAQSHQRGVNDGFAAFGRDWHVLCCSSIESAKRSTLLI
jgi:hypothetical protein